MKPYNYQNYISCLVLVLLSGHLRACQNWNFRTILRPRIQHRYKTSPTRNLVDCSVLYVLGGILKERLYKKDNRALIIISGMKVFAHLNDYILLTNCKLQNMANTWHTRGLDRLSTNKITQCCILFFRQTWTQNHDFLVWTTDLKHRCKARSSDLPKKKTFLLNFHHFTTSLQNHI